MKTLALLLALLAARPTLAADGLWAACGRGVARLLGIKQDPFLENEAQQSHVKAWASAFEERNGQPTLAVEQLPLLLEELDPAARRALFAATEQEALSPELMGARLRAMDLGGSSLGDVIMRYAKCGPEQRARIDAPLSREARLRLRAEIDQAIDVALGEKALKAPDAYVAQLAGEEAVFPDGGRLRVLARERDGSLVIEVPMTRVMLSQDYLNERRVVEYEHDSRLNGMVFEGNFTPDGRLHIVDQHHRTEAYQRRHGGVIHARLVPDAQGRYRVATHRDILNFFGHWSQVEQARREAIYAQARAGNPLDAIRPVYYEMLRLPQPTP